MMMFTFGDAVIQFALDCQRHFHRHRCHEFEQQSGNRGIDIAGRHALAAGAARIGLIEADIARPRTAAISDVHRAAAPPAHNPALQQSQPLAWRTKYRWSAEPLLIAPLLALDRLEVSP